jgi:hypothetical protein
MGGRAESEEDTAENERGEGKEEIRRQARQSDLCTLQSTAGGIGEKGTWAFVPPILLPLPLLSLID